MNDRLLGFIFTSNVWRWMTSSARSLRNSNVGPSNLIRVSQARRHGRCGLWELAIVEVEFLDPISVNEVTWVF